MIAGLIPLLVILVILGLLVFGVARLLTGRRNPETGESLEGDTREFVIRTFRLVLQAGAAIFAAEGISALIAVALPRSGEISRSSFEIAQGLSFTIVGVPALVGLAMWTRKRLEADPDESTSVVWAVYLGGMTVIAQIVVLLSVYEVVDWLVGDSSLSRRALGRVITWSAVLAAHWILNLRRPLVDAYRRPESRTPMHLLVGSGIALLVGSWSAWELVRAALRPGYDATFEGDVLSAGSRSGAVAVAHAVVGLAAWVWWWWLHGLRSPRDNRWYGYTLLVGVLGGLVATLSAAGVTIHAVLQWYFGDPSSSTAVGHFDVLPGSLATLVVGAAVWAHHRAESGDRKGRGRTEVDRVYEYLVAFAGLVVCTIAATLAVTAFVEAVADSAASDRRLVSDGIANSVVLAVTFVVLGLPLWGWFWRRAERNVAAEPAELLSISRRVYVIVTLGLSAAVALVSLVIMLTIFFDDMAGDGVSSDTFRQLRVPLGLVLATVVVAVYHGLVYREDRDAAPTPPPPAPVLHHVQRLVLVSDLPAATAAALASRLTGSAVSRTVHYRTGNEGPEPREEAIEAAIAALGEVDGREALVTVADGTVRVQALVG